MSSFSKTLAPGFPRRVDGRAAADRRRRSRSPGAAADLCSGALDQRIVTRLWKRGSLSARLPTLRSYYQCQTARDMEQALTRELGDLVAWPQPKGGFFLWASFAERGRYRRADDRSRRAHGVVYVARQRVLRRWPSQSVCAARVLQRRRTSGSKKASAVWPGRPRTRDRLCCG